MKSSFRFEGSSMACVACIVEIKIHGTLA